MGSNIRWVRISSSTRITSEPVILHGVLITCDVPGASVFLYDSPGEDVRRLVAEVVPPTSGSYQYEFVSGLPLGNGLFVKMDSGIAEVMVWWEFVE